jgi:dihydroorotase
LDTVATDHAPHTKEEKFKPYFSAPSGMPSVEFSSAVMYDLTQKKIFSLPLMAEKMCHAPAEIFKIKDRGFLREGYFADIAILDPEKEFTVSDSNVLSKCKWSPFNGFKFKGKVCATMVNGKFVYKDFSIIQQENAAMRAEFSK